MTSSSTFTRNTTYFESDIQRLRALPATHLQSQTCLICHDELQSRSDYEPEEVTQNPDLDPKDQTVLQAGGCLSYYHWACYKEYSKTKLDPKSLPFPTVNCVHCPATRLDGRLFVDKTIQAEDGSTEKPNPLHISLQDLRTLTRIEKAMAERDLVALATILDEIEGFSDAESHKQHPHVVFDSLRLAVRYNFPEALTLLDQKGCKEAINQVKTNSGYPKPLTALAASYGHRDILRHLFDNHDAKPNGNKYSRPLIQAAQNADKECIRVLVEKKATWGLLDKNGEDPLTAFLAAKDKADEAQLDKYLDLEPYIVSCCQRAPSYKWDRLIIDKRDEKSRFVTPAHLVAEWGSLDSLKKVSAHLKTKRIKVVKLHPLQEREKALNTQARQAMQTALLEHINGTEVNPNLNEDYLLTLYNNVTQEVMDHAKFENQSVGITEPLIFSAANAKGMDNFNWLLKEYPKGEAIKSSNNGIENLLHELIRSCYSKSKSPRAYDEKIHALVTKQRHPCQTEEGRNAMKLAASVYHEKTPNSSRTFKMLTDATVSEFPTEFLKLSARHNALAEYFNNDVADKSTVEKVSRVLKVLIPKKHQMNFPMPSTSRTPLITAMHQEITHHALNQLQQLGLQQLGGESQPPIILLDALTKSGADPDFVDPIVGVSARETSVNFYQRDLFAEELNLPPKSS